ncbi:hypothetical protein FOQG_03554 [Fusarium oxysporum f. sp. raphani 54005]|uniref:Uncharacterized protein n=1 Tax=Fusarium oxysporum f. sp. raphani 54005 TaxID=1089458 RepID=X0CQ20_FUSOX|nr:hypothetical protein FOQG_03554 [Fusarium oxysporum f. sp. raphani 54005]KAJ4062839.1 hypothetical protein NW753_004308 [Fusarium oxysporum]KAJ4104598.1 hypothetical protein NW756_000359 [Fusarium oxysporum]
MKVVRYEPFNRSNFEIVLQNSDERTVVPKVIINPCPSLIEDNDKTSDSKKDSGEEESDEGDGEDEQKSPKDNDEVQHGHASDSVVTLFPPESGRYRAISWIRSRRFNKNSTQF